MFMDFSGDAALAKETFGIGDQGLNMLYSGDSNDPSPTHYLGRASLCDAQSWGRVPTCPPLTLLSLQRTTSFTPSKQLPSYAASLISVVPVYIPTIIALDRCNRPTIGAGVVCNGEPEYDSCTRQLIPTYPPTTY